MEILRKYFNNESIPSDLTDLTKIIKTKTGGYNVTLSELFNGVVIGNFSGSGDTGTLATEVLTIDKSATDPGEQSPYVKYTDVNGNAITCRVLYNDSEHGLQIISDKSVTNVGLGTHENETTVTASDFTYNGSGTMQDAVKKAAASYNRAFTTLNEKAESYRNKTDGIAISARCVGSDPSTTASTADTTEMFNNTTYAYMTTYSWNGLFKVEDTVNKYLTDVNQMVDLGIEKSLGADYYWLASRYINNYSSETQFSVRYVSTGGSVTGIFLFYVTSRGRSYGNAPSNGFRPVFTLTSGAKVTKDATHDGLTEATAYVLYK